MTDPTPADDARLAEALWQTGSWPVDHVAAAVVGPTGVLATVGDTSRVYRLASVTKLLTAMAALVAIEEETLDLGAPAGAPGVTVRHLLAHAGGYGFDTGAISAPERKRIYSNTGFNALAVHLAERAGMAATEYLEAAVLMPLAMADTDLRDDSLAHGAWSSVADLARFARELLRPTLVHADTLAAGTSVVFAGLDGVLPGVGPRSPMDWGLGFEIRGDVWPHWTGTNNGPSTFGHFGGAGTFLWIDPSVDRALVVLTDRDFGPWALDAWPRLSDAVLDAVGGPATP